MLSGLHMASKGPPSPYSRGLFFFLLLFSYESSTILPREILSLSSRLLCPPPFSSHLRPFSSFLPFHLDPHLATIMPFRLRGLRSPTRFSDSGRLVPWVFGVGPALALLVGKLFASMACAFIPAEKVVKYRTQG